MPTPFYPAAEAATAALGLALLVATKGVCPLLPDAYAMKLPAIEEQRCIDFQNAVLRSILAFPEIVTIAARWPLYVEGTYRPKEGGSRILLDLLPEAGPLPRRGRTRRWWRRHCLR